MYNPDVKERFIKDRYKSSGTAQGCRTLFNALAEYENTWSADLCTRSAEEIKPILQNLIGLRSSSWGYRKGMIIAYCKWCYEHGVPGARNDVTSESLNVSGSEEKAQMHTVQSPKQLHGYLDAICDPESDENVDNVLRCFMWLGFGGATLDQALSTTVQQVSFDDMTVTYTYRNGEQKTVPIYREAVPAFKNCVNLTHFRADRNSRGIVYMPRFQSDKLLRGVLSNANGDTIRAHITTRARNAYTSGQTARRLSFRDVWTSGVCYRLYLSEVFGEKVDIDAVARQKIRDSAEERELSKDYFDTEEAKHYFRKTRSDIRRDYQVWKKTLP